MTEPVLGPVAINVPELSPSNDSFSHLVTRRPLGWVRLSGLPENRLEQAASRFRLSRYRAAWQAVRHCRGNSFIVSHLPMMTAAVQQLLGFSGKSPPHLAFAFNFTNLPTGQKFRYLQKLFKDVNQFAVFSEFERQLYSQRFDLPPERFVPTLWTQDAPQLARDEENEASADPFLCAIGGEGRDFPMLLDVCRQVSPLRVVIIARPHSLQGLRVPDNVEVLINRPLTEVWSLARRSSGVLVPLLRDDTCCGHVTLVGAKLLGIPLLTTHSAATREYVDNRPSVLQSSPGSARDFAQLAARLVDQRVAFRDLARQAMPAERQIHSRMVWADYLVDFVDRHFPLD